MQESCMDLRGKTGHNATVFSSRNQSKITFPTAGRGLAATYLENDFINGTGVSCTACGKHFRIFDAVASNSAVQPALRILGTICQSGQKPDRVRYEGELASDISLVLLNYSAVEKIYRPLSKLCIVRIVGNQTDRRTLFV